MNLDERIKYAAMKERHKKELRPWYKKPSGIVIIIFSILFILIITAYFVLPLIRYTREINQNTNNNYNQDTVNTFLTSLNRPHLNTFGLPEAPVKIIEFADFACPYCRDSYQSIKNIKQKYPDQIYIAYRDFPLHETSIFLALSARCAGEQDKFWAMHDLFFENQDEFNVSESELKLVMPEIGVALGLDSAKFQDCLSSQKYFPQIEQDYNDANTLGVQGTPTWYINNMPITGSLSTDELEDIVTGIINSHDLEQIQNNN
jgi:protein-disulfide isomerase